MSKNMHYSVLKKILNIQLVFFLSLSAFADQRILTDAGREVLLKDDGSWTYLSEDRFGTLSDGSRARLKADGSWEIVEDETGLITIPAQALKRSEDTIRSDNFYIEIASITIENQRGKNRKNSTLQAQILVDLEIEMKSSDLLELKKDLVKVSDSRGRFYDIKKMIIRENISQTQKVVRILVDGAPRWWGVKFFVVEFEQGFLGHDRKVELRKSSADVTRLEVDTLSLH